jgi:hypothetical protein
LWVSVAALVIAVPPIWPYGYYVLLRLVVTAVATFAIVVLRRGGVADLVGLAVVALLFNPIIPVHLPKLAWVPIDLGVAAYFWSLVRRRLEDRMDSGKPS